MSKGCCKSKKKDTPDAAATKSTVVKNDKGKEVVADINVGTGEVTYQSTSKCCTKDPEKAKTCGCKSKKHK